jgi:hypothetical protein
MGIATLTNAPAKSPGLGKGIPDPPKATQDVNGGGKSELALLTSIVLSGLVSREGGSPNQQARRARVLAEAVLTEVSQ